MYSTPNATNGNGHSVIFLGKIVELNITVGVVQREGTLETDILELKSWILTKLFYLYLPIFKKAQQPSLARLL